MRALADADRIRRFMRALGAAASVDTRVYFTGGATAVLQGWRSSTIDVDIRIVPESDPVFRAIPQLKDDIRHAVPEPPDGPTDPGDSNKSSGVQENRRVTYW
jgi:hypothetical protein